MIPISVIVPVYNVEKYLEDCLDSIRNQTWSDFECIMVNDGSTDQSGKICEDYAKRDSRFKVIQKENGGLSDARNTGIKAACGEYILFIDSDDWISCNMLERLYQHAERFHLQITCCGVMTVDEISKQQMERKELSAFCPENAVVSWKTCNTLQALNNITACNKLFQKKFLSDNNLLFEKGIKYEDIPFWSKTLFLADRIGCIPDSLYYYRIARADSIVNKKDFRGIPYARETQFKALQKHGLYPKYKNEFIACITLQFINCFLSSNPIYRKDFFDSMKYLLKQCENYSFSKNLSIIINIIVLAIYSAARNFNYLIFLCFSSFFLILKNKNFNQRIRKVLYARKK